MKNQLFIVSLQIFSLLLRVTNLGSGSTWPGHVVLKLNRRFIKEILKNSPAMKTIIVAGTNGKTTTAKMIRAILEKNGKNVIHNEAGANLLNGIATTLLLGASNRGKINADFALFEIDENALPPLLLEMTPDYVVLLNLFRDQLDRYGEVRTIAAKWREAVYTLPEKTTAVFNADDPEIVFVAENMHGKTLPFGLDDKKVEKEHQEHAVDSTYCPRCGNKLSYKAFFLSHLGNWKCTNCTFTRPQPTLSSLLSYPLVGVYNRYNTLAAVLVTMQEHISEKQALSSLSGFIPAFGRQEKIEIEGKTIQLFLSKNPTGMNETLRTVKGLGAKHLLFVLNDRIPDGLDVSWIWDVDFEDYLHPENHLYATGDRAYDMGVRLKYAHPATKHVDTIPDLHDAIHIALTSLPKNDTLYILPTYSAMLETRKILKGRKIL